MRFSLVLVAAVAAVSFTLAAPVAQAAEKIAVVDVQALMGQSKAGDSIEAQVNKHRETLKAEFAKLEKELSDLQKGLEKVDQKSEEFAKKRAELEKRMMDANRLVQQRRQTLDRAAAKAVAELELEIVKTVGEIAKKDGYALVVRTQNVVVAETEMDITEKVLAELNKKVSHIKVTLDEPAKTAEQPAKSKTKKN
jgi:Skp family chaperone for outer membrane proteins